ncbi:MAG: (Na+)-NQR maturation NqrM [Geminicoccaceae bacterium]
MLMETFVPALIIFGLAVTGMAVGVIFSNRRITGSCGGLNAVPGADRCGMCGRPAGSECGKVKDRLR